MCFMELIWATVPILSYKISQFAILILTRLDEIYYKVSHDNHTLIGHHQLRILLVWIFNSGSLFHKDIDVDNNVVFHL